MRKILASGRRATVLLFSWTEQACRVWWRQKRGRGKIKGWRLGLYVWGKVRRRKRFEVRCKRKMWKWEESRDKLNSRLKGMIGHPARHNMHLWQCGNVCFSSFKDASHRYLYIINKQPRLSGRTEVGVREAHLFRCEGRCCHSCFFFFTLHALAEIGCSRGCLLWNRQSRVAVRCNGKNVML